MSENDNIYRSYYEVTRELEKEKSARLNDADRYAEKMARLQDIVIELKVQRDDLTKDLLYTQETYRELHDAVSLVADASTFTEYTEAHKSLFLLVKGTNNARSTVRADIQGINRDTATRADDSWDSKCGPEGAHLRVALHA